MRLQKIVPDEGVLQYDLVDGDVSVGMLTERVDGQWGWLVCGEGGERSGVERTFEVASKRAVETRRRMVDEKGVA